MSDARSMSAKVSSVVARGLALFLGVFSAANTASSLVGSGRSEDLWWIDLSAVHPVFAVALSVIGGALLIGYGVIGSGGPRHRFATSVVSALLAVFALANAASFYQVAGSGAVYVTTPVPFSALVAVVLSGIAAVVWWVEPVSMRPAPSALGVAAVALAGVVLFPVAHVYFFGTTDYRAPADVAVVLGAKVYHDGTLSWSLEDRVRTGVELYEQGLVDAVVMSGGTGANGVDETEAMKQRAVELGVAADDVYRDPDGINTDATVRNTRELFDRYGWRKVLVVSQFYHLPRIKMAYRAAGTEVRTVPAMTTRVIPKTPLFVAREIGGFWVYWARSALRGVEADPAQD